MKCFNCGRKMSLMSRGEPDAWERMVYFCHDCHTQAIKYGRGSKAEIEWYYEYEGDEIIIEPTPESLAAAVAEYGLTN